MQGRQLVSDREGVWNKDGTPRAGGSKGTRKDEGSSYDHDISGISSEEEGEGGREGGREGEGRTAREQGRCGGSVGDCPVFFGEG